MIELQLPFAARRVRAQRYQQILRVLAHRGLSWLLRGRSGEKRPDAPVQLRLALEELGTTFIKLGQLLSTRSDVFEPEYLEELAKLQDAAPAVAEAEISRAIEAELGMPAAQAFACFEPKPLAAASIGQVHAATLEVDGVATDVVVKVQRPGVVQQIDEDIEILAKLAVAVTRRVPAAEQYDLVGLAEDFGLTLRRELDYVREGRNAERFARNFAGDETVHIPRVYWGRTTARVLTLERVHGIKINDDAALSAAGIDRKGLAKRAVNIALEMVFEHGFFHADVHPGNFFIEPDGRIGLMDFGMVGSIDEQTRKTLSRALVAVTDGSGAELADALLELVVAGSRVDRRRLSSDLDDLLSRYRSLSLGEISISEAIAECIAVMRRHQLRMPAHLALLLKTVVMAEGLGVRLDPEFRLIEEIEPFAQRQIRRELSPLYGAPKLARTSAEMAHLATELPRELRRALHVLERGHVELELRSETVAPVMDRLERIGNRLVLGMLASAFIVGLAVLTVIHQPPGWQDRAGLVFGVGFTVAAILGGYLAATIVRRERSRRT